VATTFAHAQRIAGQVLAGLVLARMSHTGQVYVSQQVFGSTPVGIGFWPFGQTGANVGQATGFIGSHVGRSGTQRPTHCWPLQLPAASHMQLGSDAGQVQVESGGTVIVPVVGSVVVPPVAQPQPEQLTSHTCPLGQSVLARQPAWMLGTQTP
jgi:hypothetical protein